MEVKNKGVKTLTNFLSKTAGLVFFSFLAISLGVVFGLLFEGWVKDQPGTPVGSESSSLQSVDLPGDSVTGTTNQTNTVNPTTPKSADTKITNPVAPLSGSVKFKVRVGPYNDRNAAVTASQQLKQEGYPVYVSPNPPFVVQVGAFSTSTNADHLKTELTQKGYKVSIDKN